MYNNDNESRLLAKKNALISKCVSKLISFKENVQDYDTPNAYFENIQGGGATGRVTKHSLLTCNDVSAMRHSLTNWDEVVDYTMKLAKASGFHNDKLQGSIYNSVKNKANDLAIKVQNDYQESVRSKLIHLLSTSDKRSMTSMSKLSANSKRLKKLLGYLLIGNIDSAVKYAHQVKGEL
jgi:hypothetical protein